MKKYFKKYFNLEHKKDIPLDPKLFYKRMARYFMFSFLLVAVAIVLGIGIIVYHVLEDLSFTDSFLNASMILGGMGPVNQIQTEGGKIFAGLYALFSGLIFLVVVGLVLAPLFHRILHKFHFEDN